jgi:hypothetical protein
VDDLKERRKYCKFRGITRAHSMENSLWKGLWTSHKTEYVTVAVCPKVSEIVTTLEILQPKFFFVLLSPPSLLIRIQPNTSPCIYVGVQPLASPLVWPLSTDCETLHTVLSFLKFLSCRFKHSHILLGTLSLDTSQLHMDLERRPF